MVNAAIDVAAEATPTPRRRRLSEQVLANPDGWAVVFAYGAAQNSNVGLDGADDPSSDPAGDGALQFVINSLWDAYTEEVSGG